MIAMAMMKRQSSIATLRCFLITFSLIMGLPSFCLLFYFFQRMVCKTAVRMERYLFSTVSVRLLITTGAFRPLSVPALRRWAKEHETFGKDVPAQRSGTIRMSAFPATGLSMPFGGSRRLVDGIVQSEADRQ